MKRIFDIVFLSVLVLDVILIAYRIVGGRQRQLVHGGAIVLPFYVPLAMAWIGLLVLIPDALKGRRRGDWKRILALAILSIIPLFV